MVVLIIRTNKDNEEDSLSSSFIWLNAHARTNIEDGLWTIMKIENGNYQDVTILRDIEPIEVDKHISEGRVIALRFISTKFVCMLKSRIVVY